MKVRTRNLLAAGLALVACSGEVARKEGSSDVAAAGAPPPPNPPAVANGQYIGLRHGPLPAGVASLGGAVVRIDGAEYAFTSVHTPKGDMVWLDSIAANVKIVRAELRVPPLARDERLLMASCDAGGKLDGRVVAIVVNQPNASKFTQVRQAWRADARAGRFDVIPVAGISCEDPGTS